MASHGNEAHVLSYWGKTITMYLHNHHPCCYHISLLISSMHITFHLHFINNYNYSRPWQLFNVIMCVHVYSALNYPTYVNTVQLANPLFKVSSNLFR